jgi:hypothetical protein
MLAREASDASWKSPQPCYHGDPGDREHVALLRHLESELGELCFGAAGPPGSTSNKADQVLECLATEVLGLGPAGAVVAGAMPWQERHARLWASLLPFVLGDRSDAHADAQGWLARARMLPQLFPASYAAHPHHPLLALAGYGGAEGSQATASPLMTPSPRIPASLATPERVTPSSEPEELVSFSGLASRQLPLIAEETESDASSACLSLFREPLGSPVLGAWPQGLDEATATSPLLVEAVMTRPEIRVSLVDRPGEMRGLAQAHAPFFMSIQHVLAKQWADFERVLFADRQATGDVEWMRVLHDHLRGEPSLWAEFTALVGEVEEVGTAVTETPHPEALKAAAEHPSSAQLPGSGSRNREDAQVLLPPPALPSASDSFVSPAGVAMQTPEPARIDVLERQGARLNPALGSKLDAFLHAANRHLAPRDVPYFHAVLWAPTCAIPNSPWVSLICHRFFATSHTLRAAFREAVGVVSNRSPQGLCHGCPREVADSEDEEYCGYYALGVPQQVATLAASKCADPCAEEGPESLAPVQSPADQLVERVQRAWLPHEEEGVESYCKFLADCQVRDVPVSELKQAGLLPAHPPCPSPSFAGHRGASSSPPCATFGGWRGALDGKVTHRTSYTPPGPEQGEVGERLADIQRGMFQAWHAHGLKDDDAAAAGDAVGQAMSREERLARALLTSRLEE